jgi:hypothetical protein
MDEKKTYLVNVESNLKKYADEAAEAKKKVDELTVANKTLKDSGKASAAEIEASNAALKNSQDEYRKAANMVKTVIAANSSELGSRKQLGEQLKLQEQALGKLGNAYIKDANGVAVLNPKYVELRNQIKGTKDQIIQYDKSLGDGRTSVGLYSEAIDKSLSKFQQMPGALGSAAGGVAKVNTAFKLLAANPIGLVITAIVAGLTLLIKAFKGNDEASEKFGGVMKGLGNVIKDILGRIVSLGKAVIDFLKFDFKGAAEEAKAAFTGMGESFKNAFKGGIEEQKLMIKIEDAEIEVLERIAQRNKEIAEIKKNSRNMDESAFERSKEFEKAEELRRANLIDELAIQKDRVALAELELKNTNANQRTDEQRKKVAEEKAKLINLETQAIEDQTNLLKRKTTLEKEAYEDQKKYTNDLIKLKMLEAGGDPELIKAALKFKYDQEVKSMKAGSVEMLIAKLEYEKAVDDIDQEAVKKSQAILQKEVDAFKKAEQEKRELKEETERIEAERKQKDVNAGFEYQKLKNKNDFDALNTLLDQEYAYYLASEEYAKASTMERLLVDQQYTDAKLALSQLRIEQNVKEVQVYSNLTGAISDLLGKQTAAGKAFAVAQAIMNTYSGATLALNDKTIPSTALRIIAAATVILEGLSNVKQILAVNTSGGGSTSAPTSISRSVAPTVQQGTTILTQPIVNQTQTSVIQNQNAMNYNDLVAALKQMPAPKVSVEDINARMDEVSKVQVRANF